MAHSSSRYLLFGQLCLLLFLSVCTVVMPRYLFQRNEGGISNYGIAWSTVVPYSLGFLGCSLLSWQAVRSLSNVSGHLQRFRALVYVFSGLMLFVLLSTYPYKLGAGFGLLHLLATVATFWFEAIAAVWLAVVVLKDWLAFVLLGAVVVAFILAIFIFVGIIHLLFVTQVLIGAGFGALLVRASYRLAR